MVRIWMIKGNQVNSIIRKEWTEDFIQNTLIEYIEDEDKTIVYLFNRNDRTFEVFLKEFNLDQESKRVTLHAIYRRLIFLKENEINSKEGSPLLKGAKLLSELQGKPVQVKIFLERRNRRERKREIRTYTNLGECIEDLKGEDLKALLPFYYDQEIIRLMKEYRLRIDQLNRLYLLEFKTFEGRKR